MNPFPLLRSKLAVKLMLPLIVLVGLLSAFAAYYIGDKLKARDLESLRQRSDLICRMLSQEAALPMLAGDRAALEVLLENAFSLDSISSGRIQSKDRSLKVNKTAVGYETLDDATLTITTDCKIIPTTNSPMMLISGDPLNEKPDQMESLGTVTLKVSTQDTMAATTSLQRSLSALWLAFVVACVLISVYMGFLISRPLQRIARAAKHIESGDYKIKLPVSGEDEVSALTRAFNEMSSRLHTSYQILEEHQRELEDKVQERTQALERAQLKLIHSEKMNALGQLVAGVAHELNNPLAVVMGFTSLLRSSKDDPEDLNRLDTIMEATESAKKIVGNLLAFAKQQTVVLEPITLNELIEKTIHLKKHALEDLGISLQTLLHFDPIYVKADYHQLQQVLLNLIDNAADAILETNKSGTISIQSSIEDEHAKWRICDDGPGIPRDIQKRLFEPFFTTKDIGKGTGLGLSIVYGIIEQHDGTITVESDVGMGTTLTITLPLTQPEQKEKEPLAMNHTSLRGKKILIVDDEEAILEYLSDALSQAGAICNTFKDVENAFESLGPTLEYDAIMSDMRMPDFNGKDFYEVIQAEFPHYVSRFVLATGDQANPQTISFMRENGITVLPKPFDLEELLDQLNDIIAKNTTSNLPPWAKAMNPDHDQH